MGSGNFKFQTPNSKRKFKPQTSSIKLQASGHIQPPQVSRPGRPRGVSGFGIWSLKLDDCLKFEVWSLEFCPTPSREPDAVSLCLRDVPPPLRPSWQHCEAPPARPRD